MSALSVEIDELERENRKLAREATLAIAAFQTAPTPLLLQRIQDEIRAGLLRVERRLRAVENARRRWRERGKIRFRAYSDLRRARAARVPSLERRDQLLRVQQQLLKQVGDSCAWVLLGYRPRLLRVLFSNDQVHHLPNDVGLVGNAGVAARANESGRFFALENDLTRVLSIGDLTVIPARSGWLKPLVLELKSSGRFELGAEISVNLYTSVAELTPDETLLNELSDTLGMRVGGPDEVLKSGPQIQKIKDRSDILLRLATEAIERVRSPRQTLWPVVEVVLRKARQNGFAYDSPESGVVIAAVRNGEEIGIAHKMFEELEARGLSRGGQQFNAASSEDLRFGAAISPFSVPIPLWPIHPRLRSDLLSGDLFYACIWDPKVWEAAFASEGMSLSTDDDGWLLQKDDVLGRFDALEVERIVAGLPFSGVSPSEVARVAAEAFGPQLGA